MKKTSLVRAPPIFLAFCMVFVYERTPRSLLLS